MKTVAGVAVAIVMFIVVLVIPLLGGGGAPPEEGVNGPGSDGGGALDAGGIPKKYVPLLKKASGAYCKEMSAPALAAQIKGESNWDPKAGSPAGAAGLAQFMPGTWAEWGKDANGNGTNSPLDPADAIDAQARFMCSLIGMMKAGVKSGRVKGQVLTLAWAAYNAGPGRVLSSGGVPPIAETQGYVVKLREFMEQYTARSGGTGGGDVKPGGKVMNPLQGQSYRLVSGFGPRSKPCATCSAMHKGQDMAISVGAPVRSACSGSVIHADPLGFATGLGKVVAVDCGGGLRMLYGHNSNVQVLSGAKVKAGAVIAASGNSGSSTGPHLHFEIQTGAKRGSHWYSGGTAIDPIPWMKKNGASL